MIIAVDFDGTIVEHKYPEIGRELPFAIETLKKLQQERHRLILWSVREGKLLQEAVDFCRERGLELLFREVTGYPLQGKRRDDSPLFRVKQRKERRIRISYPALRYHL